MQHSNRKQISPKSRTTKFSAWVRPSRQTTNDDSSGLEICSETGNFHNRFCPTSDTYALFTWARHYLASQVQQRCSGCFQSVNNIFSHPSSQVLSGQSTWSLSPSPLYPLNINRGRLGYERMNIPRSLNEFHGLFSQLRPSTLITTNTGILRPLGKQEIILYTVTEITQKLSSCITM